MLRSLRILQLGGGCYLQILPGISTSLCSCGSAKRPDMDALGYLGACASQPRAGQQEEATPALTSLGSVVSQAKNRPGGQPPRTPTPMTPATTIAQCPDTQGHGDGQFWGHNWSAQGSGAAQSWGPHWSAHPKTQPWIESQDGQAASSNSVPPHLLPAVVKPVDVGQAPQLVCDAATQTDEGMMPPPQWQPKPAGHVGDLPPPPPQPQHGDRGMRFHFYVDRQPPAISMKSCWGHWCMCHYSFGDPGMQLPVLRDKMLISCFSPLQCT